MPRTSVVIPSYNHAAFIGHAVNSVLKQTDTDFELIIVDDGSTDNSLEILSSFSDSRVKVYSQSNQGAHAAINRGLREANGKYLAILNSDDAYHPQRLEKLIPILDRDSKIGLVGSHIQIIDDTNRNLSVKHKYEDNEPWSLTKPERSFRAGEDLYAALLTENYWATTSNFIFSRDWYEQVGEFRPLRYAHDWDFALRIANKAKLDWFPEPLIQYRLHESNTIRTNQSAMILEICWILAVHLPQSIFRQCEKDISEAVQVDRLLNSIYTYGCDTILSVMLLQNLHERIDLALQLLENDNPIRLRYLEFIQERVKQPDSETVKQSAGSYGAMISRLLQWVRRIIYNSLK